MEVTLLDIAKAYIGVQELGAPGKHHPLIQWWLSLCFDGQLDLPDEIPWCSAFLAGMCWQLGIPSSHSAMARSWLTQGVPVDLKDAKVGWDVCVFWRGDKDDGVTGHVGLYAGPDPSFNAGENILVLGGNQSNSVSVEPYFVDRLLGVRRLA